MTWFCDDELPIIDESPFCISKVKTFSVVSDLVASVIFNSVPPMITISGLKKETRGNESCFWKSQLAKPIMAF
ncbi:hypothetical protein, partial [Vibrio parahaemolyticus]|uniref:hypothetical protein n=1 Tax=Vibrio parahaemolyticus TaxID=670 RepID=UPI001C60D63D